MAGADDSLAQRLLAGDRRALARGISLVENDDPEGWALVKEVYPRTGRAAVIGVHRPARRRQVDAAGCADQARASARPDGRCAVDRSDVAVHPGRAARRPDPPIRPLPRPGRVHPLDGEPRRARGAERGVAPGRAADGRLGTRRDPARDRRRRPGRGRHHRPRRYGRARVNAGVGRFDPGAQGGRDGDPRRDRDQQGRPPADRHDGARDQERARAGAAGWLEGPDHQDRGGAGRGDRGARRDARRAPRLRGGTRGRCQSAGAAT